MVRTSEVLRTIWNPKDICGFGGEGCFSLALLPEEAARLVSGRALTSGTEVQVSSAGHINI